MECKSLNEFNREFQLEARTVKKAPLKPVNALTNDELDDYLNIIFTEDAEDEEEEQTEYQEELQQPKKKRKRKSVFAYISDLLFSAAIILILLTILTSAPTDGAPKMFMGYSYFTVLTPSMQNEIPKGSLILVKQTDPNALKIGDNVTYMRDATTSVTHKIIDIYDNYENSGSRGFQTKGVNNINPDKDIVFAKNIVGKVIFVLPKAGIAISYLSENIYIVFIIFGLFVAISFLIRLLFVTVISDNKKQDLNKSASLYPESARRDKKKH